MAKQGAATLLRYGHELFLILRDDKPGLNAALQWAVLAGGVEQGETAEDAIHREVLEEIGTHVDLVCIGTSSNANATAKNTWYVGSLTGVQVANVKRGEGCALGYFSFDALQALAKIEGKGGLGGAIKRFMQNSAEDIRQFLERGVEPNIERMSAPPVH